MADEADLSRNDHPWSVEDVATLRDLVPARTIKEIAGVLKRSPRSIRGKMGQLDLTPHAAWSNPERVALYRQKLREIYYRQRAEIKVKRSDYYQRNREAIQARRKIQRDLRRDPEAVAAKEAERLTRQKTALYRKYLRLVWRLYGLTPDRFEALVIEQNGACGICGRTDFKLCVDHDHATGQVRGLLCHRCNMHIRSFEADERWVEAARTYLGR